MHGMMDRQNSPVQSAQQSVHVRHATNDAALPCLRVRYEFVDAQAALAQAGVLAVIGFGNAVPVTEDPRWLRVPLQPAETVAPLEIWRTQGHVEHGRNGALRWASDGDYGFVSLELDEAAHGGITGATHAAYQTLEQWRSASATPHWLRMWNYLDAINSGAGDEERYRQFCRGRASGAVIDSYPAATAIGVRDGRRVVQVYALAARQPGSAVENPRQVNAWRYPRQYGPAAPGFARGKLAPTRSPQLFISGTAAVVGHASHHSDDATAQLAETLANLDSLRNAAHIAAPFGANSVLKVYVRHAHDVAPFHEQLHARWGADTPLLFLYGDICRAELLVEIDGIHAG